MMNRLMYSLFLIQRSSLSTACLGYLTVKTKQHILGLAELRDNEAQMLGTLVARLCEALKISENAVFPF